MKVLNITYKFNETNVLSLEERLILLETKILEHNSNLDLVLCSEFYLCPILGKEGKIDYINSTLETQLKLRLNCISQRYQNIIIIPGTTLCFDESYNCYFNKTYIYHNGFVASHIKKFSAGLVDLVYSRELLLKDCFINDDVIITQGLLTKDISRKVDIFNEIPKGYLIYVTENHFILLQICADYCEKYDGMYFNKYKLKINLSYGLRSPIDILIGDYDFIIKSDGDLGPDYFINTPSITSEGCTKIKKDNIHFQVLLLNESKKTKEEINEEKIFNSIYNINKNEHIYFNYFQKYLSGYNIDNIETIFDRYKIFSINKNKKLISNISNIYDMFEGDKFFKEGLSKGDLLTYIHSKYNIQNITDDEIYNEYTTIYKRKYLKYKKKYLFLKYNQNGGGNSI